MGDLRLCKCPVQKQSVTQEAMKLADMTILDFNLVVALILSEDVCVVADMIANSVFPRVA